MLAVLKNRDIIQINAKAIILANGGAGYIYAQTSCSSDLTGDGLAMAYDLGLPLRDLEFVQFYPYRIYQPVIHDIFPDLFRHGAYLRNERGERFMADYPNRELENRDCLARIESHQELVYLDLSQVDRAALSDFYPVILSLWDQYPDEQFLIRPISHYTMGGIVVSSDCSTSLAGLFCCGEVTGGLHGANRLSGNALSETIVFGQIAAESAVTWLNQSTPQQVAKAAESPCAQLLPESGSENLTDKISVVRQLLWKKAGIERNGVDLEYAQAVLSDYYQQIYNIRPANLNQWLDYRNVLLCGQLIIKGALARKESRGAHYRSDNIEISPDYCGSFIQGKEKFYFQPANSDE